MTEIWLYAPHTQITSLGEELILKFVFLIYLQPHTQLTSPILHEHGHRRISFPVLQRITRKNTAGDREISPLLFCCLSLSTTTNFRSSVLLQQSWGAEEEICHLCCSKQSHLKLFFHSDVFAAWWDSTDTQSRSLCRLLRWWVLLVLKTSTIFYWPHQFSPVIWTAYVSV